MNTPIIDLEELLDEVQDMIEEKIAIEGGNQIRNNNIKPLLQFYNQRNKHHKLSSTVQPSQKGFLIPKRNSALPNITVIYDIDMVSAMTGCSVASWRDDDNFVSGSLLEFQLDSLFAFHHLFG